MPSSSKRHRPTRSTLVTPETYGQDIVDLGSNIQEGDSGLLLTLPVLVSLTLCSPPQRRNAKERPVSFEN